jgi:acyl-coenzyme A thioesterase 13
MRTSREGASSNFVRRSFHRDAGECREMSVSPPSGFQPQERSSPFLKRALGSVFEAVEGDSYRAGLCAEEDHCNARGALHGGVLVTLADISMGRAILLKDDAIRPVTVSINIDYTRPASNGQWIEARPLILSMGRRLAFTAAELLADEVLVAYATGTFALS